MTLIFYLSQTFLFFRKRWCNTIEFNKIDLNFDFDAVKEQDMENRSYDNYFLRSEYLKLADCIKNRELAESNIKTLIKINEILEKYNFHFAYRVRDEIIFYIIYAVTDEIIDNEAALDLCIVQKILPKISGSGSEVLEALIELYDYLNITSYKKNSYMEEQQLNEMKLDNEKSKYKHSSEKLLYMIRRFIKDGFTTFWQ